MILAVAILSIGTVAAITYRNARASLSACAYS
jgi:hypothetical protein